MSQRIIPIRQINTGAWAAPGTTEANPTGTWRFERPEHRHRAAPCHSHCPAGEDPQAYIAALQESRTQQAWEILVAANPLPAITGRVCHHPCEVGCNRKDIDEAIAIHGIERHLGDEAIRNGWDYEVGRPAADARTVAVVGAGPAGLACAYHALARGYRVTLFDAAPHAGGLLRTIPPYRLPTGPLEAELERLLALGFEQRFHTRLGRDVSLDELRTDFDAVFLAPGTQRAREWHVDGATPGDLHYGLDLVRDSANLDRVPPGHRVAVIGGGNTAMDLARLLRLRGAEAVHVVTFETRPAPGVAPEETMTAIPREVEQALEEGVEIHNRRGLRRLLLRGERIVGVELVHMQKMDRGNGHWEVVTFEGTETVLNVDQVIPAIGQEVDPEGLDSLVQSGFLRPDPWGQITATDQIYAGGDARGDRGTVSAAIGDGRRAAKAIDDALRGRERPAFSLPEGIPFDSLNSAYFEVGTRPPEAITPVDERGLEVEVAQGFDSRQINAEAGRCMSCGNCIACDNCWTLCPDSAVLKTRKQASDGSHYIFDYDFCKGCGLCAHECPTGFIRMVR